MNNFARYITPEQAADFALKDGNPCSREQLIEKFTDMAKSSGVCSNCNEQVWRYAGVGLCFSCTTGEADASDDIELEER